MIILIYNYSQPDAIAAKVESFFASAHDMGGCCRPITGAHAVGPTEKGTISLRVYLGKKLSAF